MSTPASMQLPRSGDTIAGRYRVDQVIGAGGMGCVLSAEHLLLKTRVAIKLLLPQAAAWPGATERFLREAQAAATLRGEHVARVVDMGTIESGAPFMVMEFLEGRDLQKVIAERAPLPISEAVDYLLQITDAIQEAHSLGILHRDIKPANLFVTTRPNGAPLLKVLDFGLAKVRASDPSSAEAALTQTGQIIGSPHYMPPEQFRGLRHADARSDIWALGVVLYELLTARRPFTGEGTSGVMAAIFSDDPTPIAILRPDLPAPLATLVMQCLEKRPDKRPPQVTALIAGLEPYGPRAERPSQVWIEPPRDTVSRSAGVAFDVAPPRDTASRSAGVAFDVAPPPGAGTVRMGPLSAVMAAPALDSSPVTPQVPSRPTPRGQTPLPQVPVHPPSTEKTSLPQEPARPAPAAHTPLPQAPPSHRSSSVSTVDVTLPREDKVPVYTGAVVNAISAPIATSPTSGTSSTSANLGISTPTSADPSAPISTTGSVTGATTGNVTGSVTGGIPGGVTGAAPGAAGVRRLAWILGASVAGIVVVVVIVARAVLGNAPSGTESSLSNAATGNNSASGANANGNNTTGSNATGNHGATGNNGAGPVVSPSGSEPGTSSSGSAPGSATSAPNAALAPSTTGTLNAASPKPNVVATSQKVAGASTSPAGAAPTKAGTATKPSTGSAKNTGKSVLSKKQDD